MTICRWTWTCICTYLYLHLYLYLLPWTGHESVTDTELVSEDADKTEMKAKHSSRESCIVAVAVTAVTADARPGL